MGDRKCLLALIKVSMSRRHAPLHSRRYSGASQVRAEVPKAAAGDRGAEGEVVPEGALHDLANASVVAVSPCFAPRALSRSSGQR